TVGYRSNVDTPDWRLEIQMWIHHTVGYRSKCGYTTLEARDPNVDTPHCRLEIQMLILHTGGER
ncbi:hypothetical protein BgiMline_012986, partial [Biomphalaria glabrata]